METLGVLRTIVFVLALVVGACYLYQVVYLFAPLFKKHKPFQGEEKQNRYAVLIAARNEENVLPHLLDTIRRQDYPASLVNVYVCADNCTDRTAEVARAHGATVFERNDTKNIGKGYVLKLMLENIDPNSYDVCLVVDADNLLQTDYIRKINRGFSAGYQAVHGLRNSKNFMQSWVSSGYALWYVHDCVHLNSSRMLLGTSCAVTGTGFGFTRELVEKMGGWNFFTLTEDIEFVTWCAINGVKIGYCPDAMLYDEQPSSFSQSWWQRIRWLQGSIQISLKYTGGLFRGMFLNPRTRYVCFETLTLTLAGYATSIILMILSMVLTMLDVSVTAGLLMLAGSAVMGYLGLFAVGLLTMLMANKIIPGTRGQKIRTLFTFPLFMLTYIPVGICAPFMKFQWTPTRHDAVMTLDSIHPEKKSS